MYSPSHCRCSSISALESDGQLTGAAKPVWAYQAAMRRARPMTRRWGYYSYRPGRASWGSYLQVDAWQSQRPCGAPLTLATVLEEPFEQCGIRVGRRPGV